MGSKPWKAITAHDPDVRVALSRAQEEAFARGEFGFTYAMTQMWASLGMKPPQALPPEQKARSIEHAREIGAESGTCSVLDVIEIDARPAPGVAGPFSELEEIVGTSHPTREQLQQSLSGLYKRLGRGEAAYVPCFEDGKPVTIWFIGMSFD